MNYELVSFCEYFAIWNARISLNCLIVCKQKYDTFFRNNANHNTKSIINTLYFKNKKVKSLPKHKHHFHTYQGILPYYTSSNIRMDLKYQQFWVIFGVYLEMRLVFFLKETLQISLKVAIMV